MEKALATWTEAWETRPDTPTSEDSADDLLKTEAEIQSRLQFVNRQIFSNREWRTYWEAQQEAGTSLVTALLAEQAAALAEAPPEDEPAVDQPAEEPPRVVGMRSWIVLSGELAENQDRYFEALQAERDTLEARLEYFLDSEPEAVSPEPLLIEDPTPYQKRARHLTSLQERVDTLSLKRAAAELRKEHISLQLEAEQFLMDALQADILLARKKSALADAQASLSADALSSLWQQIAQDSRKQYADIKVTIGSYEQRRRDHEVEMRLIESEIGFRQERIDALLEQLAVDGDTSTLITATRETIVAWVKAEGTRILLILSTIWLATSFSLRLMQRATNMLISRAGTSSDKATHQRQKTLMDVFSSIARIAVYGLALLVALEQIGVDTGPILGSVAILGLAVSFGSQNLVRDLVSGFFILLENQYTIDDKVIINGHRGRVEKITLRSTWVRHRMSGELHIIPNGEISEVTNRSRDWAKAIIDIGVGYDADLDHVKEVINRVGQEVFEAEGWEKFLVSAPKWWGVWELGDSCVVVRALAEVREGKTRKIIKEMNYRLKGAFDSEGIEIPYPQVVVHRAE